MKHLMNLFFYCFGFIVSGYAQEEFNLTIERKLASETCTMGYMTANGEVLCYTLELPWVDNQNNISCIPTGTYNGVLRYDKKDGWRIQLENVPGRTGVQIHMGNYTTQIQGCVLVGTGANVNNCSVTGSSDAYSKLRMAFYGTSNPTSTPNKNIVVTFN